MGVTQNYRYKSRKPTLRGLSLAEPLTIDLTSFDFDRDYYVTGP